MKLKTNKKQQNKTVVKITVRIRTAWISEDDENSYLLTKCSIISRLIVFYTHTHTHTHTPTPKRTRRLCDFKQGRREEAEVLTRTDWIETTEVSESECLWGCTGIYKWVYRLFYPVPDPRETTTRESVIICRVASLILQIGPTSCAKSTHTGVN